MKKETGKGQVGDECSVESEIGLGWEKARVERTSQGIFSGKEQKVITQKSTWREVNLLPICGEVGSELTVPDWKDSIRYAKASGNLV